MSKEDFIVIFLHINATLGQPCVVIISSFGEIK